MSGSLGTVGLGIFGGTFDPIHVGHLAAAESARDALGLAQVLFVPTGQPPHKGDRVVSAAEHRLAMVEAAIADNPAFALSRIEIDRDGPSYTVTTLEALADHDPVLILSSEAAAGLPTWHEPERVLRLATLAIVSRDGYPDVGPAELGTWFPGERIRCQVIDGPHIRLSGSELRTRAAAGRSLRYLVPDAVAAYIGDHGLYQDPRRTDRT